MTSCMTSCSENCFRCELLGNVSGIRERLGRAFLRQIVVNAANDTDWGPTHPRWYGKLASRFFEIGEVEQVDGQDQLVLVV